MWGERVVVRSGGMLVSYMFGSDVKKNEAKYIS
jgi:hypothetical protein